MTYCHVSAQIDRHLAEFDRWQAWQEEIEKRAGEFMRISESWDEAMRLAEAHLKAERRRAREDCAVSLYWD